ncbi:MAG TPA: hypothetical protein VH350_10300 [Candidatus Sulfotelmatobacter sp.]|jgi:hypothetical protein|nr:hypothetical protein [Candidatus Sulfotelmatobacter sp.]
MPKRHSRKLPPSDDVNVLAHRMVEIISDSQETPTSPSSPDLISKIMSEMGKKGGKIGGKRRLETMTPEERSAAALKAARARWKRKRR